MSIASQNPRPPAVSGTMLRALPLLLLSACAPPEPPPSLAASALRAKAWGALVERRYDDAEVLLQQAEPLGDGALDGVRLRYYRGLLARALGDYRGALTRLEAASAGARRLGSPRDAAMAGEMLGGVLQDLGRHAEARVIFERLPEVTSDRDRARRLVNRGWLLWRGLRAGAFEEDLAEIGALFTAARDLDSGARFQANLAINLAGVALARGDHDAARAALERAGDAGHARLLRGELALALGDAAVAEGHFALATGADVSWRGHHGVARARSARGDIAGALGAFDEATAALDRASLGAGLRTGRVPYLAERHAVVDESIAALLAAGRVERAFEVAEAARARVLRALEAPLRIGGLGAAARTEWSRRLGMLLQARDAFERAAPEAELLAGPALRTWRARRAEQARTLAEGFESAYEWLTRRAGPAAQIDALSVAAALGAGEMLVSFVAAGALVVTREGVRYEAEFDPHAHRPSHLYIVGAAPGVHRRVAGRYSVSFLPRAGLLLEAPRVSLGPAVVVADPRLDLAGAHAEGREVAAASGGRLLSGGDASRAAVTDALDGARLFHFAGHGVLDDADPWQAHLALADGRLTVADVLTARPRLGLVVLDGCETRGTFGLGMPEAFLAAGARSVLTADRVLDDASARRFVRRFYVHGGAARPGEALRRTIRDGILEGDDTWTAFRLAGRP